MSRMGSGTRHRNRSVSESPYRAGKRLLGELDGLFSARRGDYRIIYSIDEAANIVIVHRIQHRHSAYRPR